MGHLLHRSDQRDMNEELVYICMPGYSGQALPLQKLFAFMAGKLSL